MSYWFVDNHNDNDNHDVGVHSCSESVTNLNRVVSNKLKWGFPLG